MLIIGITGTNGSGKGTVVEYLVEKKAFVHYSVRGYLLELIREKGLPENRESMIRLANELRESNDSPSYLIDQLYEKAKTKGKNCIIESIRTVGEVNSLKSKGDFYLLAVEADPKLRYERILLRKSETDMISYENFLDNEKQEMQSTDPNKQNLSACMKMADFVLNNNGSIKELEEQVETILRKLKVKN
jgi:dephospho-CoA kinase